ncbi:PepSY-associated TM helix domain-containing protein [Burkholderia lata]|uniref:PepSY-associated TM helix domain-containing protein n=1 Tax=Burkholderia lata (strain ATCC 17760 / DSM 23089 / LMG 22485 / NCIMB 9086 / R18194 / 383) TaxID=482957 RepID=UPI002670047D|nr:PepSY-associated TM helix domain-containing protein [Burkholderia lata]
MQQGDPAAQCRRRRCAGGLTNLHKGVGMSIGWVLLVDTLAGALILLSLTGVLLWTELNRRKTAGVVLVIGSIVWAAGV